MKKTNSILRFTCLVVATTFFCFPALAENVSAADVVGTWEHVSTSDTPDGEAEPLDVAAITWIFNADGTGKYSQKVMGRSMGRDMFWALDGTSILLQNKKGGKAQATYTVVKKGAEKMIWKNEKLGDYYHVEKR